MVHATEPVTSRVSPRCAGGRNGSCQAAGDDARLTRAKPGSCNPPTLVDLDLAEDIQLLGEVITPGGPYPGPLTGAELDAALGICGPAQSTPLSPRHAGRT